MPPRSGLSLLVVVLVLAAGGWYISSEAKKPVEVATPPATVDERPKPPTAIVAKLPAPAPVAADAEVGKLQLPDGSHVPTLNGVKGFAKLRWGAAPFSPIDYIIKDQDGLEWYVLKNGEYLTTVNKMGTVGDPPRIEYRNIIVRYKRMEVIAAMQSPGLVEPKKQ